jgi:DnaJ-domain-containing protein 1
MDSIIRLDFKEVKTYMVSFKEENQPLINCMNINMDISNILQTQEELRNKLKKRFPKSRQPDRYALMACLITDISSYDNWSDFNDEINPIDTDIVQNEDEMNTYTCACGKKHCKDIGRVRNKGSILCMATGCICVTKKCLYNSDKLDILIKEKKSKLEKVKRQFAKELKQNKKEEQLKNDIKELELIKKKEQENKVIENQYIIDNNKYILIRMYLYNHTDNILIKFNWNFDAVIEYYLIKSF